MALESDYATIQEKYIVPYSYAILAEMAIDLGVRIQIKLVLLVDSTDFAQNWAQARHYLKKVKSYKGYDWEKILAFRIYGDEQRLARREKASSGVTLVKE